MNVKSLQSNQEVRQREEHRDENRQGRLYHLFSLRARVDTVCGRRFNVAFTVIGNDLLDANIRFDKRERGGRGSFALRTFNVRTFYVYMCVCVCPSEALTVDNVAGHIRQDGVVYRSVDIRDQPSQVGHALHLLLAFAKSSATQILLPAVEPNRRVPRCR